MLSQNALPLALNFMLTGIWGIIYFSLLQMKAQKPRGQGDLPKVTQLVNGRAKTVA
jgi:hypothetical protein